MDKPTLGGPSLPKLPPKNTETSPPSHWSLWAQRLELSPAAEPPGPWSSSSHHTGISEYAPFRGGPLTPPAQDYRKSPNYDSAPASPTGRTGPRGKKKTNRSQPPLAKIPLRKKKKNKTKRLNLKNRSGCACGDPDVHTQTHGCANASHACVYSHRGGANINTGAILDLKIFMDHSNRLPQVQNKNLFSAA